MLSAASHAFLKICMQTDDAIIPRIGAQLRNIYSAPVVSETLHLVLRSVKYDCFLMFAIRLLFMATKACIVLSS